jgi:hypothetical protein
MYSIFQPAFWAGGREPYCATVQSEPPKSRFGGKRRLGRDGRCADLGGCSNDREKTAADFMQLVSNPFNYLIVSGFFTSLTPYRGRTRWIAAQQSC